MEDAQFRQILDRFGFSWAGFRRVRKGVKKRLSRHMQETGCRNVGEYIDALERDREALLHFELLMTVSISRFFRDRRLWEFLQARIIPLLADKPSQIVKVWSAGCASGEEVYSFRILWEEVHKSFTQIPELKILATDMNPEYLERAQAGIYPQSSMREVPEEIRSSYFETSSRGKYTLRSWIKDGIELRIHHLLSDPPGNAFDLIFLRNNLLTYYMDEIKIPAMKKIVDSLAPEGFLIIGSHERMPVEFADLRPQGDSNYIFHKED